MIQTLLVGKRIELGALDLERDSAAIASWTQDPEFWNLYERGFARPLSKNQVKKKYSVEPRFEYLAFPFTIWHREENRLLGLAGLNWVDWNNGNAWLNLLIGSASDRWTGCEAEALDLLLRYAFRELNLFRLQTLAFEYALSWRNLLESRGFVLEACLRNDLKRVDRRWNNLLYGVLNSEWSEAPADSRSSP